MRNSTWWEEASFYPQSNQFDIAVVSKVSKNIFFYRFKSFNNFLSVKMDSMTSNLLTSNKFRPIIEVPTHPGPESPAPIQYKTSQNNHQELATRFLFECGKIN